MRLQAKALLLGVLLWSGLPARTQEVAHTAEPTVIRTETRLVLVDTVVTDKKGNYLSDLVQKDFKVYEDGKEKPITSFSYEANPASPNNNQKRYLVLFFDNASVSPADQIKARDAAQRFVDSNTGPNKYIAVVNFSGTLKISQNFTNDPEQLKAVIKGVKFSSVDPNDTTGTANPNTAAPGTVQLSQAASYAVSSVLLGIRTLAKGLGSVQGRKTMVMLTAGFVLDDQTRSELTATIAACNRANVSVYPVDVRGLTAPGAASPGMPGMPGRGREDEEQPMAMLRGGLFQGFSGRLASFSNSFQARGGGGGSAPVSGGGGASSGGAAGGAAGGTRGSSSPGGASAPSSGGSRGPTTSPGGINNGGRSGSNTGGLNNGLNNRGGMMNPNMNPNMRNVNNMNNMPRTVVMPTMPTNTDEALFALAEGTGGFVMHNTNDLLGSMDKIAREQDQYYILGFVPIDSSEGSCHSLKVKLDKGGSTVRARSSYCNVHQIDPLAGKPAETELESIAVGQSQGKLGSPLQLPYFYSGPNVARVNVTMEIPSQGFKFDKVKGKLHSEMNVLGIAYRPDGGVAAKFSDTLKYDFDNKAALEEFTRLPVHYENQFDIGTGKYNFKVVFSAGGENFGKIEKPLDIEPFDGKTFAMSPLALSGQIMDKKAQQDNQIDLDSVLLEDRVPLAARGFQAIPAAQYSFKQSDQVGVYFEVYDPALTDEKPPDMGFSIRIVDKKSAQEKLGSGNLPLKDYVRPGNPVVPVILFVPVKDLPAGAYDLVIRGFDTSGKELSRTMEFQVAAATAPVLGWDKK